MIKAPSRYRIIITGEAHTAAARHFITNGLDYLLGRLIRGEEVSEKELASYGLAIEIEEDCDQGEE